MQSHSKNWHEHEGDLREMVLRPLPERVKSLIAGFITAETLRSLPLFRSGPDLALVVAHQLVFHEAHPWETLYTTGDISNDVYFLEEGIIEYRGPEGERFLVPVRTKYTIYIYIYMYVCILLCT